MDGIRYYEFECVAERVRKSDADPVEKMALLAIIDGDDEQYKKMMQILEKRKRMITFKIISNR